MVFANFCVIVELNNHSFFPLLIEYWGNVRTAPQFFSLIWNRLAAISVIMDVGVIICIMIYKKKKSRQIIFVKWLKITKFYVLKTERSRSSSFSLLVASMKCSHSVAPFLSHFYFIFAAATAAVVVFQKFSICRKRNAFTIGDGKCTTQTWIPLRSIVWFARKCNCHYILTVALHRTFSSSLIDSKRRRIPALMLRLHIFSIFSTKVSRSLFSCYLFNIRGKNLHVSLLFDKIKWARTKFTFIAMCHKTMRFVKYFTHSIFFYFSAARYGLQPST